MAVIVSAKNASARLMITCGWLGAASVASAASWILATSKVSNPSLYGLTAQSARRLQARPRTLLQVLPQCGQVSA